MKNRKKRPTKRARQPAATSRVIAARPGERLTKKKRRARSAAAAETASVVRRSSARSPGEAEQRPRAARANAKAAATRAAKGKTKKLPGRRLRPAPDAVLERLSAAIARPHVELAFGSPWQLLVAVILSAQSTDRRVNQVTPEVFRRWPTPAALAAADPSEVEEVIKSTGFFRNKTRAIMGASALLVERFGGAVPRTMEELLEVPGVARKTANVVLGAAYQVASGIVVDTHAARVAQRLGLTSEALPEKIERDLCRAFSPEHWLGMSHRLVLHGRYVCTARAPACEDCPLNELCPSRQKPADDEWSARAEREGREMEARAEGFARV